MQLPRGREGKQKITHPATLISWPISKHISAGLNLFCMDTEVTLHSTIEPKDSQRIHKLNAHDFLSTLASAYCTLYKCYECIGLITKSKNFTK
jgi:hypothetical protein